jgi:16S rRNA (guanine527-N7)-methyltransferase
MTAGGQAGPAPGERNGQRASVGEYSDPPLSQSFPDAGLPPGADARFSAYLDLLAKWNRTYNLTAIRERAQMITHHLHDALAVLPFLPQVPRLHVLDIGTGGGIPGIPLAIARPGWTFVLLDANQKKVTFVTQAAIELQLRNVRASASRVETFVADAPFDVVIARAFSDLQAFARVASPHLSRAGVMVAMKGSLPHDEIDALPPRIAVIGTPRLAVPGLDAERHLVLMRPATDT